MIANQEYTHNMLHTRTLNNKTNSKPKEKRNIINIFSPPAFELGLPDVWPDDIPMSHRDLTFYKFVWSDVIKKEGEGW